MNLAQYLVGGDFAGSGMDREILLKIDVCLDRSYLSHYFRAR